MGTLYIVSTPIGNLEDITIRAIKTLFSVDLIACEDTRRTGILLHELKERYGNVLSSLKPSLKPSLKRIDHLSAAAKKLSMDISAERQSGHGGLIRLDDHTEDQQTPQIIEELTNGKSVALVSDAGTPLISDPGYKLVSEALKRGIKVVSVPGPTAAIAALTVSGLPTNHFMFMGYPPEKQSHRIKLFHSLPKDVTIIFYCAPHKLLQTLVDMKEVFGDIEIVIARELTKVHEEVIKLKVSKAIAKFSNPKGEFTTLLRF